VLNAGGNVDMTSWIDKVPALLHAWYPGQEGGTALAQLLFGDVSPSGKLPMSFERRLEDGATRDSYGLKPGAHGVAYSEGVLLGYRHFDRSSVRPQFPFGFGLSYTTFQYGDLAVHRERDGVRVSFSVRNTGRRPGDEVAQVYVGDAHSRVPRPVKELKGFARVALKPGEKKAVSILLDRRAFAYYDTTGKQWTVEPGDFTIAVGSSSEKIELAGHVMLSAGDVAALRGDASVR